MVGELLDLRIVCLFVGVWLDWFVYLGLRFCLVFVVLAVYFTLLLVFCLLWLGCC